MGRLKGLYEKLFKKLTFEDLKDWDRIFLYAGDILHKKEYDIEGIAGLSIRRADYRTIRHDICRKYPLPDNSVDAYQAEDVFEHIDYDKLPGVINEIYRVLKPGAYFRLSVPDYGCDILRDRSTKDASGEIVFDRDGGGSYENGQVVNDLIQKTDFKRYEFYHYYDENGNSVTKKIDYAKGYIQRTPDHDKRVQNPYRAMSLVVDLYKD